MTRKKPRRKPKPAPCLTCKPPKRPARWRGLCLACYRSARRLIEAGQATEAQLIADGLMLPAARGPRPSDFRHRLEQIERSDPDPNIQRAGA
jgi:hypothetical protein